ncbi:MAG: VWA domain-containing protein [Acidobacteriaceae bacterium]|nr:VWA domain-containing protein [Acidobacteriaceae bacterium]
MKSRKFSGAQFLRSVMVVALSLTPLALDAQQAPPSMKVVSRLVVLDVVVTDKKGQPVTDLTQNDFEIFEDNQPQTIRSFEPPSAHELPSDTTSNPKDEVFDPAKPANFGQSPVTILVLDQLNTHFTDSSFARQQMAEYLKAQPELLSVPTTLLVVYQDHFKLLQEFTRDRSKLQDALSKAPVKYSWDLETKGKADNGPIQRLDMSLRALEEMSQSYSSIAGRKNLIWVGGGFPSIDPESLAGNDFREVQDTIKYVSNMLLDTRMTLYAVDPTSSAAGMTEITDFQQMAFAQLSGELSSAPIDTIDGGSDFDSLGKMTGGRVIRSMNNVATQIQISVNYGAQFYTLSYSPTNKSDDSLKFRKIRVVCKRPDLVVTTRTGYYGGNMPKESATQTLAYDLSTAAESSVPLNGLHISVDENRSVAATDEDAWVIRVQAPELTWAPQSDGSSRADVTVMAVSLDKKGKLLSHTIHAGSAVARAGVNLRDASKMADFDFTAKPAPHAVMLRFVVRDSGSGRMGSFDVPLAK